MENAADGSGRCGVVVVVGRKAGCCRRVAAATAAVLAASDVSRRSKRSHHGCQSDTLPLSRCPRKSSGCMLNGEREGKGVGDTGIEIVGVSGVSAAI